MNLDSDRLNSMSFQTRNIEDHDTDKTSLSGKLMFAAIIVMFFVMVFILCLHLYARCYLLRRRRHLRARNRSTQLVFYMDPTPNPPAARRLEPSVLNSLPVFVYSPEKHTHLPECAVCLSEFEENEEGRLLPKCNHGFHIQCIDMWFLSHSTCPLCRSVVEPVEAKTSSEPAGSRERRKEQLAIDIPNRATSENNELGQISPAFISPVTRFLSFTSMLSMSRRSGGTTPSGVGTSSGETSVPEDIEKASEESMTSSSQTPK